MPHDSTNSSRHSGGSVLFRPLCQVLCVLLLAVAIFHAAPTQAQVASDRDNLGRDFYVAFGPNEGGEPDYELTRSLMALYLTSRVPAHGMISIPALSFYHSFTTTPGTITTVDLPDGNHGSPTVEIKQDEQVVKGMAIHITSDTDIAVFGMNHKLYSSDAFMALPVDVLGTEYRAMCYPTSLFHGGGGEPSEFWIIATADSTNVTIFPSMRTQAGHNAGDVITVRLNAGETYLVKGTSQSGNDLTGSLIESDYPIAVFSGHNRTQIPKDAVARNGVPSRDHLVEQLPPVSAWGDSALVVPFATSSGPDLVRIISSEDGNQILVNGVSIGKQLDAGEFYEITELTGVTSIKATKPILVGQYAHTSYGVLGDPQFPAYGDPALALVFPVEQYTTSYTIISVEDRSSFTGNFVNIVAPTSAVGTMKLDGVAIPSSEFTPIANSMYSYAQHAVAQGTHTLTGAEPFGITIYAFGGVDSYAYTGGSLLKTITPLRTNGLSIDFGDRVLNADLTGKFDTVVDLVNYSEDTVTIYGFPRRIQDTSKFHVIAPIPTYQLDPGQTGKMTIEFEPLELNRRMHTQIIAQTDHLRAYVVDVYGRGVADGMGLFRDAQKILPIDTLDFGTFDPSDAPRDSSFYIGNAGLASLTIQSATISGPDAVDFSLGALTMSSVPTSFPFTLKEAPSLPANQVVQFTPSAPNGVRYATVTVEATNGSVHTVVLKATILRVLQAVAPTEEAFDSTLACEQSTETVTVHNGNSIAVTLLSAKIVGTNAGDFAVAGTTPITIAANSDATLPIIFQPTWDVSNNTVARQAQLALQYDLPQANPYDTIPLSGSAGHRELVWQSDRDLSVYSSNEFLVPIYARSSLTDYGALGYRIMLSYDSAHLEFLDLVTANTLTPTGAGYGTFATHRGHDTISYQPSSESSTQIVTGGGPTETKPLIYLRFQSHAEHEDPQQYTASFPIQYQIDLLSPQIPSRCAETEITAGEVQIRSLCSPAQLAPQGDAPQVNWISNPYPNPFSPRSTFEYDIAPTPDNATAVPVRVELLDMRGNVVQTVVDGPTAPGYHTAQLHSSGLADGTYFLHMKAGSYERYRKVVVTK